VNSFLALSVAGARSQLETFITLNLSFIVFTFGSLLQNPKFMQGLLVIATFDEAKGAGPNRIYTAFQGDMVKPGSQFPTQASHYSLLKMIEDAFGLGNLGRGDAHASEITGIWAGNSSDE
jgi:hypothetical protein